MTYKIIVYLCILILFFSCREKTTQPDPSVTTYSQLLFERQGGGNFVFAGTLSDKNTFQVQVSRIDYRDTSIQVILIRDSFNVGLLDTLIAAFQGEIRPDGNFKQSTLETGTWAYIFLVNGELKKEITNDALRATLLKLETLVRIGCTMREFPYNIPDWLIELVEKFSTNPVGNPPQSVWQYNYQGQIVYYIPPQCCDQYSILYNVTGDILCAPDGGIAGSGDGRCPDFFQERTNELLVWQDSRTR